MWWLALAWLAGADPSGEEAMEALRRGTELRSAGRLEAAERAYLQAVDRGAVAGGWTEVGTTRAWAGNTAGALRAYDRALRVDPQSQAAAEGRARVLAWHGRTSASRAAWKALIEAAPDRSGGWVGLGQAELVAERPRAARAAFERALEIDPEHGEAELGRRQASEAHRTRGGADVGVLIDGAGQVRPTGRAGLAHALGDGWQVAAEARLAVAVGSGVAGVAERVQPALDASLSHRGRRLSPMAGVGYVGGELGGPSAVFGLDVRLRDGLVAGASVRPGWSATGGRIGGDLRMEMALGGGRWSLVRGFVVTDAAASPVYGVGTAVGTPIGKHEARVDAAWIALSGADLVSLGASWTPPWQAGRVRPRFGVTALAGRFTQVGVTTGVVF